jgi:DNA-directed RNA polymerase specialized sigma24 family protein
MARLVLAVLTPKEQWMLLRQSEGASNDEIAAEFGYADARSAAVAISRAKKKVRDRFQDRAEILHPQRPYAPPR